MKRVKPPSYFALLSRAVHRDKVGPGSYLLLIGRLESAKTIISLKRWQKGVENGIFRDQNIRDGRKPDGP